MRISNPLENLIEANKKLQNHLITSENPRSDEEINIPLPRNPGRAGGSGQDLSSVRINVDHV